ncbi:MAG: hypothetical protein KAS04_01180 [Candidatus Aenigmarchaeota archaeon]|nr:hypothetical protein [Candidatus Aenigmarchaeota archaeon]
MDELEWIFIEPFTGDILDILLVLLIWVLCLAALALILCGIFYLIDSVGLPKFRGLGIVWEKRFIESHTTTTMVSSGKTTIPLVQYHPDSWEVKIKFKNETDSMTVSEKNYIKLKHNTEISILYSRGRLSKCFYLKSIII